MRIRIAISFVSLIGLAAVAKAAAPAIELEIVTERGVQITAPQQWLQLLAGIGIDHVRVRAARLGDEPQIANRGTAKEGSYQVVGVLTSRDQLRLPGGTFSRADRGRLKDYFAKLVADGTDAVTAPKIRFGLTEKELASVLANLAQPVDFETKGLSPHSILDRMQPKLASKFAIDAEADNAIRMPTTSVDELRGVAAGTALAITLRNCGVVLRPEKPRGQPVVYRLVKAGSSSIRQSTLGKTSATDMQSWPIGWEPVKSPGAAAPSLMESLNAEIDGYSLDEALAAIAPRLKVPMLIDRAALKAYDVEPTKIQVKLARSRVSYKRVIDRILSQAHLGSEIRVDEAGNPFLWVTK